MRALRVVAVAIGTALPVVPAASPAVAPRVAPQAPVVAAAVPQNAAVSFGPGEKLTYKISGRFAGFIGGLLSGTGTMEVLPMDTVRGHPTFHIRFSVKGGSLGATLVNDRYESWLDTRSLASLRYTVDLNEWKYHRKRHFEIYPDLKQFREDSNPPQPSVEHPLDEGSFLYFIRTIPLEVGHAPYSFPYYFRPDRNPVTIEVLRRDTIKVAGREWDALVIRPIIATGDKSLFSKDSEAQIWLSNDSNRIILQLKSQLMLKSSITLTLSEYKLVK